jgi:hypothetical protein
MSVKIKTESLEILPLFAILSSPWGGFGEKFAVVLGRL